MTVEKVIETFPAKGNPAFPKGQAGVAYLAVTVHNGQNAQAMRVLIKIETHKTGSMTGAWVCAFDMMRAPEAVFDRDRPLMFDIGASLALDQQFMNRQFQMQSAALQQMNQATMNQIVASGNAARQNMDTMFNIHQAQMNASTENFNHFEAQQSANMQAMNNSAADTIEFAKGTRDVLNTTTGNMFSVPLYNATGIVDALNTATGDPTHFVQIPLSAER
jgi:hypothetical protein